MNKTQRGYLKKLADGLPHVPSEKFSISYWGIGTLKPEAEGFECSYAGCAIGWMPRLVPEAGLKIATHPGGSVLLPNYGNLWEDNAIRACFGLDYGQIDHLFRRTDYPQFITVTPQMVADRIHQFLREHPQ